MLSHIHNSQSSLGHNYCFASISVRITVHWFVSVAGEADLYRLDSIDIWPFSSVAKSALYPLNTNNTGCRSWNTLDSNIFIKFGVFEHRRCLLCCLHEFNTNITSNQWKLYVEGDGEITYIFVNVEKLLCKEFVARFALSVLHFWLIFQILNSGIWVILETNYQIRLVLVCYLFYRRVAL